MNIHTVRVFFLIGLLAFVGCDSRKLTHPTGKVVGVHDGDTITVLTPSKEQMKVRLYGIDAPELNQAFGRRAKEQLSDLVFGKEVRIENSKHKEIDSSEKDQYKRYTGWVFVRSESGETCANEEMVKNGYAWWYAQYAKKERKLADLQDKAKKECLGLWSEGKQVAPWDFRSREELERLQKKFSVETKKSTR
jgi:micrococcal nuclease